jgi:hypothetical protein
MRDFWRVHVNCAQLVESALFPNGRLLCIPTLGLVNTRATHVSSIGTCAGSTQMQVPFLEFSPSAFPSAVCLPWAATQLSLLMTDHASESFSISSCGFGLISLNLAGVFSPKFRKLIFLADLVHPGTTLPSPEGFWEIETLVIRPPLTLFRDDATIQI